MKKRKPNFLLTIVLVAIAFSLVYSSHMQKKVTDPVDYPQSLDLTAAEVNGKTLTLRDMAFYVAYEEAQVEQKAVLYDEEHPEKYWNMRVKGGFTRVVARNAAMQMAIHDELMYALATEEGITLSAEEEEQVQEVHGDFWADLTDEGGDNRLGVEEEDIRETLRRIAIAQKYQAVFAELHNKSYEDYEFTADAYQEFLEKQDYTVNEDVWKRVSFGSVTLEH